LDRFRPYSVSTVSHKQGLSDPGAVLAARDGSIWFATSSGLDRWQPGTISPFGPPECARSADGKLDSLAPNSLFEDSTGRIWASTVREFGYFAEGRYEPVSGYPGGYVHGIIEGPPGHLWVASQQAGLLHVFQKKVIELFPWPRLGHEDPATAIVPDPHGGLWLGFYRGGIAYFEDGAIRMSYSAANGLGAGAVNQLRFGLNGALFVATEGGVSRIKDGRIATMTRKNGLPCDAVQWTVRDDYGSVWLYTPCGLLRIAQAEWDAWAADPAKMIKPTVYDATDGVRTRGFTGGFKPQVSQSPDGRLWFTTFDGVSILDPRHLLFNHLAPPVHVEQVIADGKAYDPAHGQRLPPLVRDLAIDYTALSLVAPEKIRFRFKLEGQDKDWREVVNLRQVQYSNLPPRHYRFRVMAANNSGVWNEAGDSLDFSIAPAYYQTAWFLWLCVAAFLALLYGFYRLRLLQQMQHFNIRLEERVNERTRIARELHDTLLQSFQGVMLKLYSVRSMVGPAETRQRFDALLEQGQQAINEGRDAVQGMRSSTIVKNDLARALGTLGEALAAEQNAHAPINFGVAVEGEPRDLHPILRDEVYRIASEAIRNAFRHSGAQRIEIEINYEHRQLGVSILDNGRGIDPKVLDRGGREGHYGLTGMHERAKLAGGKLTVWSKLGSGTKIELIIPGTRAYIRSSTRQSMT
jgi:signal transduction histidine kinase